ncbi:MAG: calcium/sodium antiporter [Mariprofundaceae bacterium]
MTLSILAVITGLIVLIWGADRFVIGAAAISRNLGISPMIIGLTVVGFGTSAPEMLVSGTAAWSGNPGLSIGNALGSNIANIGLILGITALVAPLTVQSETLRRELPIMLLAILVTCGLLLDGDISRIDGMVLLAGLLALLFGVVILGKRSRKDSLETDFDAEIPTRMPMSHAIFWLILGLICLLGSSRLLVWGAVNIAQAMGTSDLIIGLTIVAIGTSLPELAASVMSALKKEHDLAIGNIIGSNMFNLLGVLSLPGLIRPGVFASEVLLRDFPIMAALSLLLFAAAYSWKGPGRINRLEGAALLSCFIAYQLWLYFTL